MFECVATRAALVMIYIESGDLLDLISSLAQPVFTFQLCHAVLDLIRPYGQSVSCLNSTPSDPPNIASHLTTAQEYFIFFSKRIQQ